MMYEELYNKESNHKCSSIRYSVCIPFACELCCLFEYSEIEKEPNGTGSAAVLDWALPLAWGAAGPPSLVRSFEDSAVFCL